MYWFVAAILIGAGIFLFAPATHKVSAEAHTQSHQANPILLWVSLGITLWLIFTQTSADKLLPATLFIGVLSITASLTVPGLRRFLLPSAVITAVLMLLNLVMMF